MYRNGYKCTFLDAKGCEWVITFGSDYSLRYKPIDTTLSPDEVFSLIERENKYAFLLESTTGESRLAEYSFIGFDPKEIVSLNSEPLTELRSLINRKQDRSNGIRFAGGLVGYVCYEAVKYSYPSLEGNKDSAFPAMQFGLYEDGIVFDHKTARVSYFTAGEDRYEEIERVLKQEADYRNVKADLLNTDPEKEQFMKMVEKAKEYIIDGDVLQVVLSKRYNIRFKGDLIDFYFKLKRLNPSPYMYYLKFGEKVLTGSSPEMLIRVEGRNIETFPIAGTAPRTGDEAKDKALAKALLNNEKELAEHVMLVDLARNDIGRVAEYGTVSVPEYMSVHNFSHVQHIVTRVNGVLRKGCDAVDAFMSIFPAGTVSGAPKERALEIINELEKQARGPYAGAVGYFGFNGNADFAIAIRTLIAKGNSAYVQAGAGIVADSKPEEEWYETERKAAALLKCLEGGELDEGAHSR